MATTGDRLRALEVLEPAWARRAHAGVRACAMAVTLASLRQLGGDARGAAEALDHYAWRHQQPEWREWRGHDAHGPVLAVLDVQYERERAMLESSLGNTDGVLFHLRRATQLLSHLEDDNPSRYSAERSLQLARIECYCNFEDFQRAAEIATEAIDLARQHSEDDQVFDLYRALATSWNLAAPPERRAKAEQRLRTFAASPWLALAAPAEHRLLELAVERGDAESAARLLQRRRDRGQAPTPSETTLGTELVLRTAPDDAAALRAQHERQRGAFEKLLENWQAMPRRAAGSGFLHYLDRRETIGQLVAVTIAAGRSAGDPDEAGAAAALQHLMAAQMHNTLAERIAARMPTIADVQRALLPAQGLLVFLPTRTTTHVFAVDGTSITHHTLACTAATMRPEIESYLTLLRRATDTLKHTAGEAERLAADLDEQGEKLLATLFPQPVRLRATGWASMTVIGSELLHGPIAGGADAGYANTLPLECLPWDAKTTVGERFAIDHNASLPVWWRLRERALPTGVDSAARLCGVLAAASGPTADVSIHREDRFGDSGRRTVAAFEDATVLLDEACRLEALAELPAQPRSRHASIAVFLAHGGFDGSRARGAFLQLFDRRLYCDDAEVLGTIESPFADIVVLAVCRAAKGPTRAGDSSADLGGSFLLGGATAAVQSRFDLALSSTQAAVEELMAQLHAGATCAKAMQMARRTARGAADPLAVHRVGTMQVHGFGQTPPQ